MSWCIQGLKDVSRFTLISTTKTLGSDTQINCLMSAQENIILNTKESTSDFSGMRQHQGTAHLDYFANRLHVHPVDRSNSKGRKMHEIWSRSTNMSTGHEKEIIKISGLLLQQMFLHKCASRESFNSAGGDGFQSNRWSNLGAGSRNTPRCRISNCSCTRNTGDEAALRSDWTRSASPDNKRLDQECPYFSFTIM